MTLEEVGVCLELAGVAGALFGEELFEVSAAVCGCFVVDQPKAVVAFGSGLVACEEESVDANGEVVCVGGGDRELAGGDGAWGDEPQADRVGEQLCEGGVDVAGEAVELVRGDAAGPKKGGGARAGCGELREEFGCGAASGALVGKQLDEGVDGVAEGAREE